MNNKKTIDGPVYDARALGTSRMLVLGLQHMFAMFGATVLVPALTGLDVATTAISQLAEQLAMAPWERVRPMAMMMGPVTMGGKYRMTFWGPKTLNSSASTRYRRPAQATPKDA